MRTLPLLALVLVAGCIMVPRQSTTPSASPDGTTAYNAPTAGADGSDGTGYGGGGASGGGAYGSPGVRGADGSPGTSAPAGPTTVSVTIRSSCAKTVKVFYGDKPRFSSGTESSVSSNSVSSKTFQEGDMMWVLDDRGEGVGSATISASTRNIEINSSCTGLSAR
jgi:hypothetical protein